MTISVYELGPVITAQPQSVSVSAAGEKAKVSVTAQGEGLTYQWYYLNAGAGSYVKSSIKSSVYSVSMQEAWDGRQLYCVVTDANGNTVKSGTAMLSIQ